MGQMVEGNTKSFLNGGTAIARGIRVKLSSGKLTAAGIGDRELGVMTARCEADEHGSVYLRTAAGTVQMVASKSITSGAAVYTAANGKVSDAQGTGAFAVGQALEAASGDGSIIEVLRYVGDETAGS